MGRVLNRQLGLENLKRHSFENTTTGKTLNNSSVLSGSVQDERLNGGRPTLIPFLYDGRVVDGAEAVERALASKRVWPAFDTNDEATVASKKISNRLGRKKK
jgi:hypothetical protein